MIDPNPSRATPLGGRTYPAGAAGTQLVNGLVLSGDDAPAFARAGYTTMPMHVQCSARIAAGEDTAPDETMVSIAIERHGADLADIARWTHAEDLSPAVGIYDGTTNRAVFGYLRTSRIESAHAALTRELPGFECFAVMTPRHA